MSSGEFSPSDALDMEKPAKGFLCPLKANTYLIDFISFKIVDYDSRKVLFNVQKDESTPSIEDIIAAGIDEKVVRTIRYDFDVDVLRLPRIQTSLEFSVGPEPIEEFYMIERHYFRDRLIKSFDFKFGFCMPNSRNSWETTYEVPALDPELVDEIVANPYETRSDSFYFANGKLAMHNKAEYAYRPKEGKLCEEEKLREEAEEKY